MKNEIRKEKNGYPTVLSICYVHSDRKDYLHINLKQNTLATEVSVASSDDGRQTQPAVRKGILEDLPHLTGNLLHDASIIDHHLQQKGFRECHSMEQMRRGVAFH
jgi:hypothetical protein